MNFDVEYKEATKCSLKRKGSTLEKEGMEEKHHAVDMPKEVNMENKHVEDLSEEEGVGAIQKWLEENSCPSKESRTLPGASEREVLEISMEIF